MKFKVGDHVRCVDYNCCGVAEVRGVVKMIYSDECIVVREDGEDMRWYRCEKCLELIEPAVKPSKIRDRLLSALRASEDTDKIVTIAELLNDKGME